MAALGQYSALDNRNLIGIWERMYETAMGGIWAPRIGRVIPSNCATETYDWLGAAPYLTEQLGEAAAEEQLKNFSYTLKNKEYSAALKIAQKDLQRDKLGQLNTRIGEMSQNTAEHWNDLVSTLITDGTTGQGYDSVAFFHTAHAESGTSQANLLTSSEVSTLNVTTTTAPTATEAAAALLGVIGKFYGLTNDKGKPINGTARSFTCMVGTSELWGPMQTAVSANVLSSGVDNPIAGLRTKGISVDVIFNPLLSASTTQFYVFRNDAVVPAFILQEEIPVDPQSTDQNSDEYKKFRRFIFSVYTSRAAGYGRWQSAMKATFA